MMNHRRDQSIRIRVSAQERQSILIAADCLGQSMSEFLRKAALQKAEQVENISLERFAVLKRAVGVMNNTVNCYRDSDNAAPSAG